MKISERRDYSDEPIRKSALQPNPFDQLHNWMDEAILREVLEPNAMILATVSKNGRPSTRTVLFKELDDRGLVFYTNTESRKAHDIADNPWVSLTILWLEFPRQILISGTIEPISRDRAKDYFSQRPRRSQIGASASRQGEILQSRKELERKMHDIEKRYEGQEIPIPEDWGGYCVVPETFEFWHGRRDRIHDRFLYVQESGEWVIKRLSP